MHYYCLLVLMWFPFMASEPSFCDLCMHTTWAGSVVTGTLLFHTYHSWAGSGISSCTHNHTNYLVCSHGNHHRLPSGGTVKDPECLQPWEPFSRTQVFGTDKPVSMFFDACAATDKGGCGGIGCGCGGLAWERAYTSNDKYMGWGDNYSPCDDVHSYYCPYWACVSWATWQRAKYGASFTREKLPLNAPLAPVTL
jgi:hypothetical protein